MELRELRNFIRVARAGSINRAAIELRLAQPALSRQIAKLERELGVALFARYGRGVRLTAAGSLLLERAETIGDLVRQTGEEIREERAPSGGRIVIGLPPASGRLLVAPLVERFQRERPLMSLQIREGATSALQDWLLDKRIDVAMLYNPPPLETLDIRPLATERMWLIGPPPAPRKTFSRPGPVRFRDLADIPLALPSLAHNNRRLVEQAALEHGIRLRIKLEVDSVAFAKAIVEQGVAHTILTFAAVQEEVALRRLSAHAIARLGVSTRVSIVTLLDRQLPRLVQDARDMVHDVARQVIRDRHWPGAQLLEGDGRLRPRAPMPK
ncbi:MAG TPA: LysR substrate-binding domain-containing protein [Pseudolabrys sp.]|nr:LysR substrate-binding domain-containing protein [Pseudolabrys sp.]